jgi:hypothetical protein
MPVNDSRQAAQKPTWNSWGVGKNTEAAAFLVALSFLALKAEEIMFVQRVLARSTFNNDASQTPWPSNKS